MHLTDIIYSQHPRKYVLLSVQMEIGTREEICYKLLLSFIICLTYLSMSGN